MTLSTQSLSCISPFSSPQFLHQQILPEYRRSQFTRFSPLDEEQATTLFVNTLHNYLNSSSQDAGALPSLTALLHNHSFPCHQSTAETIHQALFKPRGYFSRLFSNEPWEEWTENRTALGKICSIYVNYINHSFSLKKYFQRLSPDLVYKADLEAKNLLEKMATMTSSTEIKKIGATKIQNPSSCLPNVISGLFSTLFSRYNFPLLWGLSSCLTKNFALYPLGESFLINHQNDDEASNENSAVTGLTNGNFVVTWQNMTDDIFDKDILGRLYDYFGRAITPQFRINTHRERSQFLPKVANLTGGKFVVIWESYHETVHGIYGQLFDSNATKIGTEFQVNTNVTTSYQKHCKVTGFVNGNFVAIWLNRVIDLFGISGQLFSSNGTKIGTEFQVTSIASFDSPSISELENNNFIVVWSKQEEREESDPSSSLWQPPYRIYGQMFNSSATKIGGAFPITNSSRSDRDQQTPFTAHFPNTRFVVAWEKASRGLYGQLFSSNATKISNELTFYFPYETYSSGSLKIWDIAVFPSNDFVILFQSFSSSPHVCQLFASNGTKVGESFFLNAARSYSFQDQLDAITENPTVAQFAQSNLIFTWTNYEGNIFGQIFSKNAAPVLTAPGCRGSVTYSQNRQPVVINPDIILSDSDDATLIGAEVTIIQNFVAGQDILNFSSQNEIVGSFDNTQGVLVLTGAASVAHYQAALRSITYQNLAESPESSQRTITFTVRDNDNYGTSVTDMVSINFLPVLISSTKKCSYIEKQPAVAINPTLSISEREQFFLQSAKVAVVGNFTSGDQLHLADMDNISGNYSNETGVLHLSGVSSISNYQTALRRVTYKSQSTSLINSSRIIHFTVNDSYADSDPLVTTVEITPVNDAPVIQNPSNSVTYHVNSYPVEVYNTLSITDVDSSMLTGAKVAIIENFFPGEDLLSFTPQGNISGDYNATTGVLSLIGIASIEDYQVVLRTVSYRNISEDPNISSRAIRYTVSDSTLASQAIYSRVNIDIPDVNESPVLSNISTQTTYTENQPPLPFNQGLILDDVDTSSLSHAEIVITDNFFPDEDVLHFTNQNGIVGHFEPATGVLTLTGTASTTYYQSALRSVTYENRSENPHISSRTLQITVNDGNATSNVVSHTIAVVSVLDRPNLSVPSDIITYIKNQRGLAITPNVILSDVDSSSLNFAQIAIFDNFVIGQDLLEFTDRDGIVGNYDGAKGVLTLSGTAPVSSYQAALRSVTYRNSSPYPIVAPRGVTFTAGDASLTSDALTVTINILDVNIAPYIANRIALKQAQIWRRFELFLPSGVFEDPEKKPLTFNATQTSGAPLPSWLHFDRRTHLFSGIPTLFPWAGGATAVRVYAHDQSKTSTTDFQINVNFDEMIFDLFFYYTSIGMGLIFTNVLFRFISHYKIQKLTRSLQRYDLQYKEQLENEHTTKITSAAIQTLFADVQTDIQKKTGNSLEKVKRLIHPLSVYLKENRDKRLFDLYKVWPMINTIASNLYKGVLQKSESRLLFSQANTLLHLLDCMILNETRKRRPVVKKYKQKVWKILNKAIANLHPCSCRQVELKFLLIQCRAAVVMLHDDQNLRQWACQKELMSELMQIIAAPPLGVKIAWKLFQQIPNSWYAKLLYIRQLTPLAREDFDVLKEVQKILATENNQNFLYGGVLALEDIAKTTRQTPIQELAMQKGEKPEERGLEHYALNGHHDLSTRAKRALDTLQSIRSSHLEAQGSQTLPK